MSKLTDFSRSLRGMVDLDTSSGLLRLREPYRGLAGALTPRQLKFYLRARLGGTSPSEPGPAATLLKQLFPVFWQISRDEPEFFAFIIALARTALAPDRHGSRQLALFYEQLKALTAASVVLTPEGLKQAWPGQIDERVLLLQLLSAIHWELSSASQYKDPSRQFHSQADTGLSRVGHPSVSLVPPPGIGGGTLNFADWVRGWLRVAPKGATVAEQVSSFQDMALAAYRQGNPDAVRYVGEYASRFLDDHKPFFPQDTATSLSNLAVIINDAAGYEAHSDSLFDAAVTLDPKHVRIPLYYADFLLTVALAPTRVSNLVPKPYPDILSLLNRADGLIAQILRDADEASRFYASLLRLRLDFKRRELQAPDKRPSDDSIDEELRKLVSDKLVFLLASCCNDEPEPFSRLDQTLDMLVGRNDAALPRKAHIFGLPWGVADASGLKIPTWPMAIQIANNYVGQSLDNSPSEKLGLRINLSLLKDAAPREPARTAAIWTQTLLSWAHRPGTKPAALRSRAALGLLAALEYGGQGENWERRAERVWGDLGGKAPPSPETLKRRLNADHRSLYDRLQNNLNDPDLLQQVVTAVFQQDLGEPISTLAALAEAENWKDWPAFQQEVARMAADHRNELEKLSQ